MTLSVSVHRIIIVALMVLAAPAAADPMLSVVGYELVSQKRIGSTVFEYAYRISVHNAGTAAEDVEIDLRSVPEGITVMEPATSIAHLNAGATGTSTDPVIVRHDRTKPFRFDALGWALRGRDATFTGRLSGAPSALATSVTKNFVAKPGPRNLLVDAHGNRIDLTEIRIVFAADATVGQVNAALDSVSGRISGMGKGQRNMELTIPNPWSLAVLNDRLRTLFKSAGVVSVWPSVAPQLLALPNNPPFLSPTDPGFFQDTSSGIARSKYIDHHLAIRAHAAWNLTGLLETPSLKHRRPVMIYVDSFLNDRPARAPDGSPRLWASTVHSSDLDSVLGPERGTHGHRVMSVVSGSFGDNSFDSALTNSSEPALVTGLFPGGLDTRVINRNGSIDFSAQRQLIDAIASYTTDLPPSLRFNVILNTSIGYCDQPAGTCKELQRAWAWSDASNFVADVRNRLLDADQLPTFLHVYAVGNNPANWAYYDIWGAADANYVTLNDLNDVAASKIHSDGKLTRPRPRKEFIFTNYDLVALPDLVAERDASGALVLLDKLPNMLGVEARIKIATQSVTFPGDVILGVPRDTRQVPPVVGCPASFSTKHGSIAGIGEAWMLDGVSGPAISHKGTSYAAPQVAAVAAWIWSLAPQLKVADVRRLIVDTAAQSPVGGCIDETEYAKTVDVYAAALATDNPHPGSSLQNRDLGSWAIAPARAWLLDVASVDTATGKAVAKPDGKFTQADIMLFLQEFEKRKGVQTPDYSRYDLNGNGVTGEPAVRQDIRDFSRFDLDGNLNWGSAVKVVEGVNRTFKEDITADLHVLIYYAYSPLYTGNEYERTLLLLPYMQMLGVGTSLFLDRLDIAVPGPRNTTFHIGAMQQLGEKFLSQCSAERGAPLYSSVVGAQGLIRAADSKLYFWRPMMQAGRLQERPSNAVNCSSFVAALPGTGLVWVSSAARNVDGATKKDEEYQTRFFLGEPDLAAPPEAEFKPTARRLATQTLTYGIVAEPGGNFIPVFNSPAYRTGKLAFVASP